MRTVVAALVLTALVHAEKPDPQPQPRVIDLALCLDTSNSMDGLIDSARQRLWSIVNDLALAKPTPRLRVALLAYGNNGYDPNAGWVKVYQKFTEDLDLVSQQLFALKTNGGTELVGRVLQFSLTTLDWQTDPNALKLIVVAGNETADQDQAVPYRQQCRNAIQRGIMINAIYCGNPADRIAPTWREIAALSDGQFAAIDQDRGTVKISTPFDAKLAALSGRLNTTYLPIGEAGRARWRQQSVEDKNAAGYGGDTAALRGQAKASKLYYNSWDVVDALDRKKIELEKIEDKDLPEILRGKTLEEKWKIIAAKKAERKKIQSEIADLGKQREQYVAAEMKKKNQSDDASFDANVRKALRAQAAKKGYKFED